MYTVYLSLTIPDSKFWELYNRSVGKARTMYLRIFRWEIYAEKVPPSKTLLDWDFSPGENHIWLLMLHIVFNRR